MTITPPTPHSQSGFTLIELMIVISIIGILAAIALPAYQDYVGRAQAMEAVKITVSIRDEVGLHAWEHKAYPSATDVSDTGYIGVATKSLKGKYVADNGVSVVPNTGVVKVQFSSGALKGEEVRFIPILNSTDNSHLIQWVCESDNPRFLPSSCRAGS